MISIIMAVYNGERYLSEQIDSILAQSHSEFSLHIRDDASSDNTWDILTKYEQRYPDKIKISRRDRDNNSGSAKHNFLGMMVNIKDDYIMLCDQDDVWLPDKIKKTFEKMKEMEGKYGTETPIMVHTDLQVVDQDLKILNPSYKQAMNSNFNRTDFHQVLIQNILTGCTAMYNRSLSSYMDYVPQYCVMHDWWLLLLASAFGKVAHISDQTILYRQHGENSIGAKDVRTISYKLDRLVHGESVREAINITYLQAKNFLQAYQGQLTKAQKDVIEKYCEIPKLGKWSRLRRIFELGTFKNGLSRNIAYFIFI